MTFSVCVNQKKTDFARLKQAGVDGVELNFSSLYDMTEEETRSLAKKLREVDLPVVSCNGMFPGSIKVTGKSRDFSCINEYLRVCTEKASILGVKTVVFGSSVARALDGDNTRENAYGELSELLRDHIAPIFRAYGMTCSIEPLSECDLVHTLQDALLLAKMADAPEVGILADFFHVLKNGEPLSDIRACAPYLFHTHIASFDQDRCYPRTGDADDYPAIFRVLREIGYDGAMSIEGKPFSGDEDVYGKIRKSVAFLRSF